MIISLDSKENTIKFLQKRVMIAGLPLRTQKFEEKSNEQCQKCQKIGHDSRNCKNNIACQICGEKHITRLHRCNICTEIGSTCIHTILKCVNCQKNHRANSKECEYLKSLKSNSSKSSKITESSQESLSTPLPESDSEEDELNFNQPIQSKSKPVEW